jgi:protease-4
MASLALVGFAARPLYLKGLLDRAGVEADVYAKGRFKSMGELFVRDSMSDAQHEQMDALLDGFYSSLVDGIAAGRTLEKEAARALIDEGPYFGARAKSSGLVDDLCHEDEVAERLGLFDPKGGDKFSDPASSRDETKKTALKAGEKGLLIDGHLYDAITLASELPALLSKKKIVVLPARGSIVGGHRQQEGVVADRPFIATVQALAKDPNVAGVVLLVDSGGGSALASDRMHHALVALGNAKPLVAYFSNVAASGGYYLGAAAKKIVARPRTITGSIGVVAVRPVVDGVLGKLGVVRDGVVRGKNAGLLEAGRRLDEEERSAVMRELDGCYEGFLGVVGAGRGLTREEVLHVAEGRVWTGEAAASNGLVDRLGGLETAIEEVRALGGEAAKDADIALVSPPKPTLANLLRANLGAEMGWAERALTTLGIDGETLALAAETGPLFVSPIRIE